MQVDLIAMGAGGPETLTAEAAAALTGADWLVGAERLLAALPAGCTARRTAATRPAAVRDALLAARAAGAVRAGVVLSGDTGFYSGAAGLLPLLREENIPARVLPGVSSVQLLAARLGRPWQNWRLVSAHGVLCDPAAELTYGRPVFFLTGGVQGPAWVAARLRDAGLPDLPVTVGERLGLPGERITHTTAADCVHQSFDGLSVLLAEAAPRPGITGPGVPDELFCRGRVPMTKREVRAAAMSRLRVQPSETCWDVGAGTGSVSIELALAARGGAVWAVEQNAAACDLIRLNRRRFGTWNLHLREGLAPAALADLPAPDAVFVGGTKGNMAAILAAALEKNPAARICVSAIAPETLAAALAAFAARGLAAQAVQIAVSRSRAVAGLHLMEAANPITLVAANCP